MTKRHLPTAGRLWASRDYGSHLSLPFQKAERRLKHVHSLHRKWFRSLGSCRRHLLVEANFHQIVPTNPCTRVNKKQTRMIRIDCVILQPTYTPKISKNNKNTAHNFFNPGAHLKQTRTRNATRCNNRNDLLHLSFTLKILIFSNVYI